MIEISPNMIRIAEVRNPNAVIIGQTRWSYRTMRMYSINVCSSFVTHCQKVWLCCIFLIYWLYDYESSLIKLHSRSKVIDSTISIYELHFYFFWSSAVLHFKYYRIMSKG